MFSVKRLSRSLGLVVLLVSSLVARVPLRGEELTCFEPANVAVVVEPAEARDATQWQLLTQPDRDACDVGDGAWIAAGDTYEGVAPDGFGIACQAPRGWTDPDIPESVVVRGVGVTVTVSLATVPVFPTVDEITPQAVRHGETLRFLNEENVSMAFDLHPEVDRESSSEGRW